jgi:hypothetical protein
MVLGNRRFLGRLSVGVAVPIRQHADGELNPPEERQEQRQAFHVRVPRGQSSRPPSATPTWIGRARGVLEARSLLLEAFVVSRRGEITYDPRLPQPSGLNA